MESIFYFTICVFFYYSLILFLIYDLLVCLLYFVSDTYFCTLLPDASYH